MKTTLKIEIETPDKDKCKVEPLETLGMDESEMTEEQLKEKKEMQESYPQELHDYIVYYIENYFDERIEEESIDAMEEICVEGYDSFKDYGIKVKCEVVEK